VNPLSAIYSTVASARNRLYDNGTFRQRRLAGPVVSVGNISAGGSGKTPFVILLGELLKQRGIAFDVLSRGYGRKSRGVFLVDPNGSSRDFGDEPILIAKRLGCPVIVGESRYRAGLFAESKFGPQLHILDDGFQHRSLARDFDIVLLTGADVSDQPLPTGRLREPVSALSRADAVVLMGEVPVPPIPGKPIWRVRRDIEISNAAPRPLVFCGIARPEAFLSQLNQNGITPVATRFFRDHHAYSAADIRELTRLRAQSGADGFITTEKDAINLGAYLAGLQPCTIARVRMELQNAADALDSMLRVIGERKPRA
jgi:tetraacyldisaccharide 4'-kinase